MEFYDEACFARHSNPPAITLPVGSFETRIRFLDFITLSELSPCGPCSAFRGVLCGLPLGTSGGQPPLRPKDWGPLGPLRPKEGPWSYGRPEVGPPSPLAPGPARRTKCPWSYGRGGPEDPPGPWARREVRPGYLLGFQGIEVDYVYWGGIWYWSNYSSFPCLS